MSVEDLQKWEVKSIKQLKKQENYSFENMTNSFSVRDFYMQTDRIAGIVITPKQVVIAQVPEQLQDSSLKIMHCQIFSAIYKKIFGNREESESISADREISIINISCSSSVFNRFCFVQARKS